MMYESKNYKTIFQQKILVHHIFISLYSMSHECVTVSARFNILYSEQVSCLVWGWLHNNQHVSVAMGRLKSGHTGYCCFWVYNWTNILVKAAGLVMVPIVPQAWPMASGLRLWHTLICGSSLSLVSMSVSIPVGILLQFITLTKFAM